jgi:O-antigen/teichoic acid export membrane protein
MPSKTKRLVKNTLFLYIRMFLLMFVGLYSSRVLLATLGVEDLGIFNVVASVVLMLEFVSSSLTNSSQRYLSIGLGKSDLKLTNNYFAQSVGIHFLFSICIVIIMETAGLWLLNEKLNIPENRQVAASWLYQFSVLAAFIKINQVCFQSVIIARENMSIYAYLSIFEATAKLAILYLIASNTHFDKLIFYGALLLVIQFTVLLVHIIYCSSVYPESRYKLYWDNTLFKEMFSFVSVNIFGSISWSLGVQGISILLNIFFGPVINTARGLATTAGRFINQFINNIYLAIKPQLIKSYAKGEVEEMLVMAEKSTVYIFYMVLIVTLPLLFETNYILRLWLSTVPEFTTMYTKLVIIQSYFWMLPIPYSQIATATGKIKNIQLYGRIFTLMSLPISYGVLLLVKNPYYPIIVVITMDSLYWLYTIQEINKQLSTSLKRYLSNVVKPIAFVSMAVFSTVFTF